MPSIGSHGTTGQSEPKASSCAGVDQRAERERAREPSGTETGLGVPPVVGAVPRLHARDDAGEARDVRGVELLGVLDAGTPPGSHAHDRVEGEPRRLVADGVDGRREPRRRDGLRPDLETPLGRELDEQAALSWVVRVRREQPGAARPERPVHERLVPNDREPLVTGEARPRARVERPGSVEQRDPAADPQLPAVRHVHLLKVAPVLHRADGGDAAPQQVGLRVRSAARRSSTVGVGMSGLTSSHAAASIMSPVGSPVAGSRSMRPPSGSRCIGQRASTASFTTAACRSIR